MMFWAGFVAGVAACVIVLAGVAWWFYREIRR